MDYEAHLEQLRELYIKATPRQRLGIAVQRISNPDHGPNLLVAYVSALEGFARCLAMHQEGQSKTELCAIYPKYRNMSTEQLITEYLQKKIDSDPLSFFGQGIWKMIRYAVKYRNLLAHECTYLGQDKHSDLIAACAQALRKLADVEGLEFERT
jgi:hypothetical protein